MTALTRRRRCASRCSGEVQGEALAFTADGTLLATGETPSGERPAPLHAVPGATALATEGTPATSAGQRPPRSAPACPDRSPPSAWSSPSPLGVFALVAVVAVVRRRTSR